MRKRIKDLIAKAGTLGGLIHQYRNATLVPGKPKSQLTNSDIMRLSLREFALSRGIPPGFHRWPTPEEYARIAEAKEAEKKKIQQKLLSGQRATVQKDQDG